MRRAGVNTGSALPAHRFIHWLASSYRGVRQYGRDSHGGTKLLGNEQGTLANPTQAGPGGRGLVWKACGESLTVDVGICSRRPLCFLPLFLKELYSRLAEPIQEIISPFVFRLV